MSITLGGYTVETKKTVGELPAGSDNIIAETPCEEGINLATVQPKWKKIHDYTINDTALFNGITGLWEVGPIFHQIGDDDTYADGYDYEIFVDNITFLGPGPINPIKNHMSYTIGGNNWYQPVISGLSIIMNENNCGGSYSNTSRAYLLNVTSPNPFSVTVRVTIKQLIPATIEIEVCYGGTLTHLTELEEISEDITVYVQNPDSVSFDGFDPIIVSSKKRNSTYDPFDLGPEEYSKMPQTCLGYSVYYISSIFSSAYFAPLDKTYWLDEGIYKAKINIPKVPPQVLDFKLWDGSIYVFDEPSDANGLIDWIDFVPALSPGGVNTSLELWNGGIQENSSGEQYVYFRYDLESYDCPCDVCGDGCGGVTIIFHQSCGDAYSLKFNLMVQDGKYNIEGETFTQGGGIIRPITKIKATYDLVLSEYSDETYLLLMELIADNILIEVVDNIDTSNPTTEYYIDTESLTPTWNFNSKLGTIVIPVIRKDTIRTARRNCCN
jgi:hypothetical protein